MYLYMHVYGATFEPGTSGEGGRENVGADTVTWKMVPTRAPLMNAGSALKGSDWHEVT
jgi:hypothetical protein